jgi:hypothetical protein
LESAKRENKTPDPEDKQSGKRKTKTNADSQKFVATKRRIGVAPNRWTPQQNVGKLLFVHAQRCSSHAMDK